VARELSYAEDVRLNYNPEKPVERFAAAAVAAPTIPKSPPWPEGKAPTPRPLSPAPAETDDLSRFKGYDAIVMTYTSAEAATLAALFTPGHPVSSWYEYRHGISAYLPIVTGKNAPFNSDDPQSARYRHSLGLYFPCTIGSARVLLVKSGLHLDYDVETVGSVIPFNKMVTEMVQTVKPKLFITTGTGGGIGADVKLGDVIIAGKTLFNCTKQFSNQPWAHQSYTASAVPAKALDLMTPGLLKVNAEMIAAAKPIAGRAIPKIWSGASATIVTTDVFAFDTSSNEPYHLHPLGQCCDMGDAMVGQAMHSDAIAKMGVSWYAIRNASDPQIPDSGKSFKDADNEAGEIYKNYGAFTTAASVIASWAIIAATA